MSRPIVGSWNGVGSGVSEGPPHLQMKNKLHVGRQFLASTWIPVASSNSLHAMTNRLPTHVRQILAISNNQLNKLAEMVDGIMAVAGSTSSIHVIDADNQDLKTMLREISSRLSCLKTRKRSSSRGPAGRFHR
ncbi:hypothetical protein TNIN_370811 [Trichonephila inaurata madagascariensis]|uniref:Uncharacterized protein n=1 Tax=Trichonephila inaurata madagascariensis TaxID=2747483 RepID=A0A8X6IPG4_9ARAC|nr:hypothetical protein TNIN_370811 [Trichonephila inaurata madagascariensis]